MQQLQRRHDQDPVAYNVAGVQRRNGEGLASLAGESSACFPRAMHGSESWHMASRKRLRDNENAEWRAGSACATIRMQNAMTVLQ